MTSPDNGYEGDYSFDGAIKLIGKLSYAKHTGKQRNILIKIAIQLEQAGFN